jgi:hypothetical protein
MAEGKVHYRETKPPRRRPAQPAARGEAQRRRSYLSRLSEGENAERVERLEGMAGHDLRERRRAEAAAREREREQHNAANLERLRAEVRAREAKKARVNKMVDDFERSERGGGLTADDLALVKDFKEE